MLSKVARWDPDKHWLLAIQIITLLKQHSWQPLLIARGGVEAHGADVLHAAAAGGLRVIECIPAGRGIDGLLQTIDTIKEADMVNLRSPLDASGRRVLFRSSAAVLANSSHEPFGLVGLETMAAGGLACTGSIGEDYVVPGLHALVLETRTRKNLSPFSANYALIQSKNARCGELHGQPPNGIHGLRLCSRYCPHVSGF